MKDATPADKAPAAGRATKRALNNPLDREQGRAVQEAHEACLYKTRTGELGAEVRLLGRQKRRVAVADTLAAPHMQQVYSRAAGAAPPPVTPYVDRTSWTVSVEEVAWAVKKVAPKTPGPGGVDVRSFKKYAEELAPVLTRALSECQETPETR
jgi:hypothetical protein